jgi:hypothetical protein
MALKYECDKCGELTGSKDTVHVRTDVAHIAGVNMSYDLCIKCTKELAEFLKG